MLDSWLSVTKENYRSRGSVVVALKSKYGEWRTMVLMVLYC